MAKFEITGAKRLNGSIRVAGNKNSVLPIMAACLLTEEPCLIENVPNISDVSTMAKLMEICGAQIEGVGTSTLRIVCTQIKSAELPRELTHRLRASILLAAPLLTRCGQLKMAYPGGDVIGRRPLDSHFQVFTAFGAKVKTDNDYFHANMESAKGKEIFLMESSVTATENAIMIAAVASGPSIIKRAASEPHVVDLCNFLIKMGAKIEGIGTNILKVEGSDTLHGAEHSIRPDHIEAGTFAILGAITGGKLEIAPVEKEDMDMILMTLAKFNVVFKLDGNKLTVSGSKLKAVEKVVTDVWPGFPTDLMAPMIVLASQASGVTILHDWMYESRMFFVDKLLSMGAKVEIADPHRVFVYGSTKLHGQKLDTPDIRAGIALVLAALIASGKSEIDRSELIERGYENIVERLSVLGANIKRIS